MGRLNCLSTLQTACLKAAQQSSSLSQHCLLKLWRCPWTSVTFGWMLHMSGCIITETVCCQKIQSIWCFLKAQPSSFAYTDESQIERKFYSKWTGGCLNITVCTSASFSHISSDAGVRWPWVSIMACRIFLQQDHLLVYNLGLEQVKTAARWDVFSALCKRCCQDENLLPGGKLSI